ncbi:MAG TPA: hypothetical protein VF169_03320 [Albitalea sp.]|uniref:hypothetical protein n=1 Tax=Piscinibacter sp. TaxID=1903157 RepID=UPI002ED09DE9
MISITLLSLPADAVRRLTSHRAADETSCRSGERALGLAVVVAVSVAASLVAWLSF